MHTLLPVFERLGEADLLIAGAGSQEAALRRAAPGGNVCFLGRVGPARLAALYRRAVAVIVPSLALEVFPLVALEALREGTPIVVPDRGALPEIAHQSGGGLVYGDEEALLSALRRLLGDRAERARLGAAGRRAWRSRWTADVHFERYLALIDRLEAEKAGS